MRKYTPEELERSRLNTQRKHLQMALLCNKITPREFERKVKDLGFSSEEAEEYKAEVKRMLQGSFVDMAEDHPLVAGRCGD